MVENEGVNNTDEMILLIRVRVCCARVFRRLWIAHVHALMFIHISRLMPALCGCLVEGVLIFAFLSNTVV